MLPGRSFTPLTSLRLQYSSELNIVEERIALKKAIIKIMSTNSLEHLNSRPTHPPKHLFTKYVELITTKYMKS